MEQDIIKIEAAVEAILFAMGEAVPIDRLAAALEHDVDTTRKIVHHLMDQYDAQDRGIRIIEMEDALTFRKNMY